MKFCETFELLYRCNINLHLHGHLAACIVDYGPVYSFWLFLFEHLNGVMGSFHTNCHDISLQLVRRFHGTSVYVLHTWSTEYRDELTPFMQSCGYSKGSLIQTSLECFLKDNCSQIYSVTNPFPPV